MFHHLLVGLQRGRQRFPQPALETRSDVLAHVLSIVDGVRQDVIEINFVVHIVDVEPQIICVELDRIEIAAVYRLRFEVGLDVLRDSRQVFEDRITLLVLRPLLELVEHRIIDGTADVGFEDRLGGLVADGDLIPFGERTTDARTVGVEE